MVVLICDAQAPYHSSWHWEIESQWSVARGLMGAVVFGRRAETEISSEDRLREVAQEAMKEYVALLRTNAKCDGEPWLVNPRVKEDDVLEGSRS